MSTRTSSPRVSPVVRTPELRVRRGSHNRRSTRVWSGAAAAAVLVLALLLTRPGHGDRPTILVGTSLVGTLALAVGSRRQMAGARLATALLALGCLVRSLAPSAEALLRRLGTESPLLADGLLLSAVGSLVLAVGVAIPLRRRRAGRSPAELLDGLVVVLALALAVWVAVLAPLVADGADTLTTVLVPAADAIVLVLAFGLVRGPGSTSASTRLVVAAALTLFLGDSLAPAGRDLAVRGHPLGDVLPAVVPVLLAFAVLHPSAQREQLGGQGRGGAMTAARAGLLTVAALVPTLVLGGDLASGGARWADLGAAPLAVTCSVVAIVALGSRMVAATTSAARAGGQLRDLQNSFRHQATHDTLTDLPNRAQVLQRLSTALRRGQQSGEAIGLLFVDLDGFKAVNDTYGHRAGDEVLRQVSRRIRDLLGPGDIAGRLGGDEFVVVLERFASEREVLEIAESLILAVSEPITIDGSTVGVGASVGLAISRDGATDVSRLLEEADTAAYRAKAGGRGRVEVFDEILRQDIRDNKVRETAIATGLRDDEFVLYYQPVIDLVTKQTRGFEALLRWRRPGHGVVGPEQFIPVAEASGIIRNLGCWVLERAAGDLASWIAEGGPMAGGDLSVAVNLSGRHLARPHVVQDVADVLARTGLAPQRLVLEITETVLLDDPRATKHLQQIRDLGVGVSIDDFGTGYASIGQLRTLPVDTVKIDQSFVRSTEPATKELVRLMVGAAHAFGLDVVAEGIEDTAQLADASALGCELGQGFLFGKPVPADRLPQLLSAVRVPA